MTDSSAAPSRREQVGYEADVLGLQRSPLEDIYVLGNPDTITHVWKGGQVRAVAEGTERAPRAVSRKVRREVRIDARAPRRRRPQLFKELAV